MAKNKKIEFVEVENNDNKITVISTLSTTAADGSPIDMNFWHIAYVSLLSNCSAHGTISGVSAFNVLSRMPGTPLHEGVTFDSIIMELTERGYISDRTIEMCYDGNFTEIITLRQQEPLQLIDPLRMQQ